jgi:stage III sporulation protein SpoIIIAA
MNIHQDLDKLLENLPFFIQEKLKNHVKKEKLIEIILDLGRRPEVRFTTGPEYLSKKIISWQDIDYIAKRISDFSDENRAGINRTLHRISCIRNRQYLIIGLTCRVGRAVFGSISLIRDLLESELSILILGKPGVGKTTVIREIARILSDELEKRVIIVDTSNEIAGDSNIPHSGIGRARRMQVSKTEFQHQVMIEAVENHMPEVIIIDEIGTELEALAARTIAEKGVQLVATTHGNSLENLIKNPSLSDLIGGIQYVTLSDNEAKRRKTKKSILERKAYPAFQTAIEINEKNSWTIHENIKNSIDYILSGNILLLQARQLSVSYKINIKYQKIKKDLFSPIKNFTNFKTIMFYDFNSWTILNQQNQIKSRNLEIKKLIIYSYSISNNLIKESGYKLGFKLLLTKEVKKATIIIGLKKHLKYNFALRTLAKKLNIPIFKLNQNSVYQLTKFFRSLIY